MPEAAWAAQDPGSPYRHASLETEGFIHCTDGAAAMRDTANRHYAGDPRPFLVLTIDLDAAGSAWRIDEVTAALGDALVEAIKPLAKATSRAGSDAALGGFALRLFLLTAIVWAVKDQPWVDITALGFTLIVTHLGLLIWETRHVSASLAYPGLKPTPTKLSGGRR